MVYEWQPRGRVTEAGVPEKLMHGRFKANKRNRLTWKRKKAEAQMRQQIMESMKPHKLTKQQQQCGARRIV